MTFGKGISELDDHFAVFVVTEPSAVHSYIWLWFHSYSWVCFKVKNQIWQIRWLLSDFRCKIFVDLKSFVKSASNQLFEETKAQAVDAYEYHCLFHILGLLLQYFINVFVSCWVLYKFVEFFVVFRNCQFNLQCEDDFSTLYVVLCQNISGTHPWDDDIWCWHAEGSFGERCFWFPESICKTLHISLLMFWIVI